MEKIAFLGFNDKFLGYQQNELYIMDKDGKNVKNISKDFDRNVTSIFWSGDSKKIFFKYDDYGITKLGYFDLSGQFKFLVSELGGLSQGGPTAEEVFRYREMTDMLSLLVMFIIPLILQLELVVLS